MTEHTPGKWHVNNLRVESESGWLIANVNSDEISGRPFANARLIAAAPDLLAALKDVCTQYAANNPAPMPAWIRNARAAIAKTEK